MTCPSCGGSLLRFPVDPDLRPYLPGEPTGAGICRSCLAVQPVEEPPEDVPAFTVLDDAMPNNPEAAVPMALLLGLLESLAVHRQEITALLERVERAGTDPLLVVDRLADSYGSDAHVDLGRRRHQLEQLI